MEYRGAEARVEIQDDHVLKKREPKKYRDEDLDLRLRKERTEEELKNMKRARKYGANTPKAEKTSETSLKIEKIDGETAKEIIEDRPELTENLGENIAKIHSGDVIHGDLTTSNAIWTGEDFYLIDFGLSQVSGRTEDRAVDVHLLKQVMYSSHPEVADKAWESFLRGYDDYEGSEEVLERLEEVESRGRYK
jgi:TP53 regulating kinase-like protein